MPRIYTDPKPQLATVKLAAEAAVAALSKLEIDCCIFGGYACYLNGNTREPNDVDIIVLASPADFPQEQVKRDLTRIDSRFTTVASRNPHATYRVLWFRPKSAGFRSAVVPCKVDVLLLGTLNIPPIPTSRIEYLDSLPCAPLPLVFLLKLQGWEDHTQADKEYLRVKQHVDVTDINKMVPTIVERYSDSFLEECRAWIPAQFIAESIRRVNKYVNRFPSQRKNWKALGFDVGGDLSSVESLSLRFSSAIFL